MAGSSSNTCTKRVLIEVEEDSIRVGFVSGGGDSDCTAITLELADQLHVDAEDIVLKVQSDDWGGRWVNVRDDDVIPDKTVLKAILRSSKVYGISKFSCYLNHSYHTSSTEGSRHCCCDHNCCC